ncbi:DUF881 domain-containing protein [Bacillus dakarensis]|uniref:DUF881 domain-containing protein n=1 Tax=Robertmurraya dakarensis TaxID=1926278 RepID=UPI001F3F10BE|nr:DUF881 domain-containing protein [Bacillus dakarensis]
MGKKSISLTFITLIVGFMLAIQFQSVQEPVVRDTRDTWQLREDLQKEKDLQARLIREIRSNEEKLAQYETERKQSKEEALRNTLNELKEEVGLTDVTGPGVKLYIDKVNEGLYLENVEASISPDSLKRLLNEINMYGAKHVSVGGQRVINTTVIREIAGETKINGRSLKSFPIEILIVTEDFQTAKKLANRMEVSEVAEEFFIDNLTVNVLKPEMKITVPAYEDVIRVRNIEAVKSE